MDKLEDLKNQLALLHKINNHATEIIISTTEKEKEIQHKIKELERNEI
jgi:hypothetical protein